MRYQPQKLLTIHSHTVTTDTVCCSLLCMRPGRQRWSARTLRAAPYMWLNQIRANNNDQPSQPLHETAGPAYSLANYNCRSLDLTILLLTSIY